MKNIVAVIAVTTITTIITGCTPFEIDEVTIPIRTEIENSISVKGLENKFIAGVVVGGAGGLGAPAIYCFSPQQFVDLVPPGEPIYTTIEQPNCREVKKVYWAFLENRSGVVIYEDVYSYKEDRHYQVKNYTPRKVTFDNSESYYICVISISSGGILLLVLIVLVVLWLRDRALKKKEKRGKPSRA